MWRRERTQLCDSCKVTAALCGWDRDCKQMWPDFRGREGHLGSVVLITAARACNPRIREEHQQLTASPSHSKLEVTMAYMRPISKRGKRSCSTRFSHQPYRKKTCGSWDS